METYGIGIGGKLIFGYLRIIISNFSSFWVQAIRVRGSLV